MVAAERWMDVTANNLANVSTTGFKRDGLSFTDMYVRTMSANGGLGKTLGTMGSGVTPVNEFTDFERGALNSTGNPLDVAIESRKGLFAVQQNGQTLYTRDGSFSLNNQRQLVTPGGGLVLDRNGQPIDVPAGKLEIAEDGGISVDGKAVGSIGLWDGPVHKMGANMFTAAGTVSPMDPTTVQLKQGSIEGSNVNAIDAMINMITIGRSYELSQKSITQQDDLTQKLIQSLQ